MATFELWNVQSGNLLGTFTDEAAALDAVAEAVARNGASYGDGLALGRENSRGTSKIVASGRQLVDLVAKRGRLAPTSVGERRSPAN
jgi:hypothetical protein